MSKFSYGMKSNPQNPEYFKKRTCIYYANDLNSKYFSKSLKYIISELIICILRNGSDNCDGCQTSLKAHPKNSPDNKWDSKKCTVIEQTDAFSTPHAQLKFTGFKSKRAKVMNKKMFF